MDQKKTGEFIQQLRKAQGLTQKELADKLGISDKTVSKWETGNGLPDIASLSPLCKALGINVNELLSGEKLPPQEYTEKAEENMMSLLKENETTKKSGLWQMIIGGVLAVLAILFLITSTMGLSIGTMLWYVDTPSLIGLLLFTAPCVILSGAKDKLSVVTVLQKSVIPAGCFIALFEVVLIFGLLEDFVTLGPSFAVASLPPLYALFVYLLLIPVKERMKY